MSKQGNLKDISGKVYAQDPQGNVREIQPGDTIYEGELAVNDAGIVLTDAIHLAQADQSSFTGMPAESKEYTADSNSDKEEKPQEPSHAASTTSSDEAIDASHESVNIKAQLHQSDFQNSDTSLLSDSLFSDGFYGENGSQESSDTVGLASDALGSEPLGYGR